MIIIHRGLISTYVFKFYHARVHVRILKRFSDIHVDPNFQILTSSHSHLKETNVHRAIIKSP